MRSREEVLREFGLDLCVKGDTCPHYDCTGERRMADAILTRDDRIAALEAEVARVGRVVACAQSFDHAATVSRLNPDDVAMHFTELHIALQELRALTPTQEPTNE